MKVLYVDGFSLQQELDSIAAHLGVQSVPVDYGRFFGLFGADRIYYYDAWPEQKGAETKDEFEKRWSAKEAQFRILNRTSNVHVRTGTSRWKKKEGLRQKAVDVLLAVDAVTHALEGMSDHSTFIASDLDYYPVLEVLQHTRVKSLLIFRPRVTSDDLIEAADNAQRLTKTRLLEGCEPQFAQPHLAFEDGSDWNSLKDDERNNFAFASFRGQEVALKLEADGRYLCRWNGAYARAKLRDVALERLLSLQMEELKFSDGSQYP